MKEKRINKSKVDVKNARSVEYKNILENISNKGVCPFCPKTFKWHNKPILKKDKLWFITTNFYPYKNTKFHFLIVGKKHKENFTELTISDLTSIMKLIKWVLNENKIKGGAFCMRFGSTLFTGATVSHLHAHLIVPVVKNNKPITVQFPIG